MDKTINYQLSFNAVSIRAQKLKPKKTTDVIKQGFEHISKLNDGYLQTFNDLEKRRNSVTLATVRQFRQLNGKPIWTRIHQKRKIRQQQQTLYEDIVNAQNDILEEETKRLKKMETIVSNVEKQTDDIENSEVNSLSRDKIEEYKASKQCGEKGFSSIAGYNSEKNILNKYFISQIEKEKNGEPANVPGCVLFFGPTGNGKTTFARAFAKETDCNIVPIRLGLGLGDNKKYNKFWNKLMETAKESEKNFRTENKRTIIFIDEFAKISNDASPITSKIDKFLRTCSNNYHCTVFAATNNPLSIKLPLTGEKSVFPYKISLDPPNKENKAEILKYYLDERLPKDTNYMELAEQMEKIEKETEGRFNIAQIKEAMEQGTEKEISKDEVTTIINSMTPTITKNTFEEYTNTFKKLMDFQVTE